MGLDMYLKRKTLLINGVNKQYQINVTKNGKPLPYINPERINEIEEEVGYWRKFNALHNWFVENVQDGVDECQTSELNIEQLEELVNILKEIQTNPKNAHKLLPTVSGFFFGGTDYDEYYFESVSETIELLEKLIKEHKEYEGLEKEYFSYYYHASW